MRCHCLCGITHPDEMGICDYRFDVVLVEMPSNPYARVVPFCGPCRVARAVRWAGLEGRN